MVDKPSKTCCTVTEAIKLYHPYFKSLQINLSLKIFEIAGLNHSIYMSQDLMYQGSQVSSPFNMINISFIADFFFLKRTKCIRLHLVI